MTTLDGVLKHNQTDSWHADLSGRRRFDTDCTSATGRGCPIGYWQYNEHNCSLGLRGRWYQCGTANPMMCPDTKDPSTHAGGERKPVGKLSEDPVGVEFVNEKPITWQQTSGEPIRCSYKPTAIKTAADVQTWIANFGQDETYKRKIMPAFCSTKREGAECAEGLETCSVFNAKGLDGDLCREWKENVRASNPALWSSTIQTHCVNHKTSDCGCVLRGQGTSEAAQLYNQLKKGQPYPDGCWWAPCSKPSVYLVAKEDEPRNCPTDVCQQVFNAAGLTDSTISVDARWNLTCAKDIVKPDKPDKPVDPDTAAAAAARRKFIYIVAGSTAAVVLLLIIILAVWLARRKRKTTPI